MNYNNILTGYKINSQIPLNAKANVVNEAAIKSLGTNNKLAYTYEKGLTIYCQLEGTRYEWREAKIGETIPGLLTAGNFTYPTDWVIAGVVYSNKIYNFFNTAIIFPTQVQADWNATSGLAFILNKPTIDGSQTKIVSGANVSITGIGTLVAPFTVSSIDTKYLAGEGLILVGTTFNNTAPDKIVSLTGTGATSVTGVYPNFVITSTDTLDQTVTIVGNGATTVTGTYPNFVITSIDTNTITLTNLQRTVTASFTLADTDNNYTIIIANGINPITITVPLGLMSKINVGLIQQGSGNVNFLASGTTINTPVGNIIKGQNHCVLIEQVENSNVYQLSGNTKV